MGKNILKELPDLVEANVITPDIAERIRAYYAAKETGASRLILVFSILGALLIGLGIILIIAHNWDELSRTVKLVVALAPLLIGQLLCLFTLKRKSLSTAWREGSAIFLFCAIGASIAITSQVYNMPSNLGSFLFIWMLLSIPVIYVMQSSFTSLLVIGGLTWYACEISYFNYPRPIAWYYWPMLASVVPYYIQLWNKRSHNFLNFHSWFIAISLTITLGMFADHKEEWIVVGYVSLFSAFVMTSILLKDSFHKGTAYLIIGSLGHVLILLAFTFRELWKIDEYSASSPEFIVGAIISFIAIALLIMVTSKNEITSLHPSVFVFVVFIPLFFLGPHSPNTAKIICNVLVLSLAVLTTKRGADEDNLFILNYGLLIMTALILCRFFDTDLSFVMRGVLFILVGLSFFAANMYTIRKRKSLQA
jgi:uncharacterized membrane protein